MAWIAPEPSHPPRVPLVFRVGVVGHRPNRLTHANQDGLRDVLKEIVSTARDAVVAFHTENRKLYAGDAPVVRAISPLAEGTDRLFARIALDFGCELCCPFPFVQSEFETDFSPPKTSDPQSLGAFRALIDRARHDTKLTLFELDGDRSDEGAAYEAAGRVVLNQSDLLVVVWDGNEVWDGDERGTRGGTEATFAEARKRSVPTVWVDAHAPHRWQMVRGEKNYSARPGGARAVPTAGSRLEEIDRFVRALLEPPPVRPAGAEPHDRKEAITIARFYAEAKPRVSPGLSLWNLFCNAVADLKPKTRWIRVRGVDEPANSKFRTGDTSDPGESGVRAFLDRLHPYGAWPDGLAVYYSDCYRSVFLLTYLLSALAVGAVLLPRLMGWPRESPGEVASVCAEFAFILFIILVIYLGRHRQWHERWVDYRIVVELMRPLSVLPLLGESRPLPEHHGHLAGYGSPSATWMGWYVRGVERFVGLPSVTVNRKHLEQCLESLATLLEEQLKYHVDNSKRCHRIEHRLHAVGITLFGTTLVACAAHLLPAIFRSIELPHWLTAEELVFIGGFFPALGAGLTGISNQAEFVRVARRSEAMTEQLRGVLKALPKARATIAVSESGVARASDEVISLMSRTAALMVNEVLDWRVVLLDRPVNPPA